ncbi:MAG TPA: folylpolyglutamate synthase/dihydrofolate synthase family protein [Alcanivorax sp.]|nr:folylpolyglutamate synthase/dihydrofolate synthase family protein [Alcanivorax sp.]
MSDSLDAWLARIEKLHPSDIELGLERVRRVAEALGVARLPMPVITVAGTNGKGSVVALTRALAEAAGRRVCVYTSPHLQRFNERITLPDGPVDDDALCAAFEQVDAARGDTALTYFEFTTLAALRLFRDSGADLTILEVGLGGRLDAVNLIDADVAVVTSVGLDHTDWLGDSREKVAVEKLGIGRAGRPLVYGEDNAPANLDAELARLNAVPLRAGHEFQVEKASLSIRDAGRQRSYPLPLPPRLGADNLATACQALVAAGMAPADDAPHRVAATGLVGRCQVRRYRGVQCVLDVGHNLEALTRLRERLPVRAARCRLVLGMMADKPVEAVVALFTADVDDWYLARPAVGRAADTERLARALPEGTPARRFDSVAAALEQAVVDSKAGDQVLIVGSFHTVAEALNAMDQGD